MYTVIEGAERDRFARSYRFVAEATHNGFIYTVGANFQSSSYPRITGKSISVSGEESVSFDDLPDGWMYDDSPEIVKECKRRNKIEIANQRAVIAEAVEIDGLPDWASEILSSKLTFSRKAGCSCGCSPGFKIPSNFTWIDGCGYVSFVWVSRKPVGEDAA